MTKPLPFTRAAIRRAVDGARAAGIEVTAVSVAPDGTLTVHKAPPGPVATVEPPAHDDGAPDWGSFQA